MAGPFCHVLVGWDGSAAAAEALSTALTITSNSGHVVALAVVRRLPHDEAGDGDDDQADLLSQAEAIFERARRGESGAASIRMATHVITGDEAKAGAVLCSYAAEHGFDLLVLGRHGQGGLLPTRLGRVAKAVAQSSPVPVLLVDAR
jgi:nucleotide-binding universal stress UspA family protein